MTTFTNEFSREIYEQAYRYGDETINDTHLRVATDLASIERDQEKWKSEFLWALEDFKFVPGGRITSNAGTGLKSTSYINCAVSGFIGENKDSMTGIMDELKRQADILKSEQGYGFCCSVMRPSGGFIRGIANSSPGAVRMLDMWDTQSAVITMGSNKKSDNKYAKGKIRKGAQMVTMHCWHPDIEEFIKAKQTPGRLTKFNMSVLITDNFMEALDNNRSWNLEFPDYETDIDKYNVEWDGDLDVWKSKGYPVKIFKSFENANQLWDIIMESTYNRNEPGVIFLDVVNRLNNLYYIENINATNPCGEQILPIGGVCLLGSINLSQFVNHEGNNWDYDKLKKIIHIVLRMMDNVNDISKVPIQMQKDNMIEKRRVGLGILGYASALMMMKIRYGSVNALKMTEELMNFFTNEAYKASAILAKEKGVFPLYDKTKYLNSKFVERLNKDTIELIEKYGIRNSHVTSIQPTGHSSVFANNVSGGLEPIFSTEYTRTSTMPHPPNGLYLPDSIDWINRKALYNGTNWEWTKEGDENLLWTTFDNYIWKIDKSRGLLRETNVEDYAVKFHKERETWDSNADWVATTTNLTIDDHIETMKIFSYYVDSSISKTVNIPNNYNYKDFKNLYYKAYKTGSIKGITTYRAGTMSYVLSDSKKPTKIQPGSAPPRPKELDCDIHLITYKKVKHIVLIGLMDGIPYEVFSFKEKNIKFTNRLKNGKLVKSSKDKYNLVTDTIIIEDLKSHFDRCEENTLTRMISAALRYGADINFIYNQLIKSEGSITSFSKAIARALSKYVTELDNSKCDSCGDINGLIFQEGCVKCKNCGYSKCE
jgi:ribonucleoside-diphosphate reductase alpha chain